jgi:DNA polymerase-3 subunit gamma/tau
MENFIVSARKYRPQNFATVVGQSHITTTLKNAITHNQLAHAFLFCGPRGVGKTTCARILAKTINCENRTPEGEACNACNSCVSFDHGTSLNIHELDAASNNSVDDIRSLVEQVRFAPQAGKYKVYIVDEVHMLSAAAFNAFLKTLEEPPPYAIFILATTEKHKILPTILSRCQIFDFKRITNADTVAHLSEIAEKEHIDAEKSALHLIAQKSEGCMRDSLSILDKIVSFTNGQVTYQNTLEHLNILDEDYYFKLLEALLLQDLSQALLLFDEINKKGFEGDMVINGFAECLRNLMVCKDAKAAQLLDVVEGMQEKYLAKSQAISLSFLISALNVLNESELQFKAARNRRLHVEMCIIKLCYLQQALELSAQPDGSLIKKKRIDGPVAVRTKSIAPILYKKNLTPATNEAWLVIEEKAQENKAQEPRLQSPEGMTSVSDGQRPSASEGTTSISIGQSTLASTSTTNTNTQKKSLLDAIKEKHQVANLKNEAAQAKPLDHQTIKNLWQNFSDTFREKGNHSIVNSLETAEIQIVDNDLIEIVSLSSINQKLIEQVKVDLVQMLQQHFGNNKLQFRFSANSSEIAEMPLDSKYLPSQERFRRIVEQYPIVQELKDKLRLELDY